MSGREKLFISNSRCILCSEHGILVFGSRVLVIVFLRNELLILQGVVKQRLPGQGHIGRNRRAHMFGRNPSEDGDCIVQSFTTSAERGRRRKRRVGGMLQTPALNALTPPSPSGRGSSAVGLENLKGHQLFVPLWNAWPSWSDVSRAAAQPSALRFLSRFASWRTPIWRRPSLAARSICLWRSANRARCASLKVSRQRGQLTPAT